MHDLPPDVLLAVKLAASMPRPDENTFLHVARIAFSAGRFDGAMKIVTSIREATNV